ncbi:MAG: TerC family protein [Burkholderiales bacterium]|nr:TerC family protein [Burkholderiales bacterium]MCC7116488.1 TerC family protein [Burkholderiales bacterium]
MELAGLGFLEQLAHPQFWVAVVQIIIVDILLAGDNAVVIALACRNLPPELQKKGIFWGVAGAILLRVVLTAFAATLLSLPWLKLVGGVALLWIGIKLLLPAKDDGHQIEGSANLWGAVRTVVVADFVMSVDNVIGVAGAAKGNLLLLVFGLVVSIPLVVVGSKMILRLIERWPFVILAGGALLGWIAGELVWTDPVMVAVVSGHPTWFTYLAAAAGAVFVVVVSRVLAARAARPRGGTPP